MPCQAGAGVDRIYDKAGLPFINLLGQNSRPRRVWSIKHSRRETQHELLRNTSEVILLPGILGFTGTVYETTVSALPTLCMESTSKKAAL